MTHSQKYVLCSIIICSFFTQLQGSHSQQIPEKISKVEKVIQQDPGNRGVSNFYTQAIFDATQTLEKSQHVAILTGFFIQTAQQPETDGPLGSMFLAQALMSEGKKVTLVTDIYCLHAITACYETIQDKIPSNLFTISVFPEKKELQESFVSYLLSSVDCLVSIERVGRSLDGTYRNMRGLDITPKTAPLDDLFLYAQAHPEMKITTIAVGDGGNEIGMGEKQGEVKKYVSKGDLIACVVPADHLIVTGVSNWGGYALAGALWCKMKDRDENTSSLEQVYPSNEEQFLMLQNMINANCCDGVLGKPELSVDGLSWNVHEKILNEIRAIIQ
jgi:hypothetical protein